MHQPRQQKYDFLYKKMLLESEKKVRRLLGTFLKSDVFANKIERTYKSIYKQILGVTINASNKHVLAEMQRTSLKLDIEIRILNLSNEFLSWENTDTFLMLFKKNMWL